MSTEKTVEKTVQKNTSGRSPTDEVIEKIIDASITVTCVACAIGVTCWAIGEVRNLMDNSVSTEAFEL
jgi:hypothetical protein